MRSCRHILNNSEDTEGYLLNFAIGNTILKFPSPVVLTDYWTYNIPIIKHKS